MRGHQREGGSERETDPPIRGRAHACAREVEAVGLPQPIDELHLIGPERRHDFVARPRGAREERLRRLHLEAQRRLHDVHEQPADPVVGEGPLRVQAAADRIGNAFVETGQVQARDDIEMFDAVKVI